MDKYDCTLVSSDTEYHNESAYAFMIKANRVNKYSKDEQQPKEAYKLIPASSGSTPFQLCRFHGGLHSHQPLPWENGTISTKNYDSIYVMILSGGRTYLGAGQDPGFGLGLVWFGGFNVVNVSSIHYSLFETFSAIYQVVRK